jgi:hypothetical protein
MILGREWLKQNGVRLYFDLGYLRIDKTYVRLEEDIHISSFLRLYLPILNSMLEQPSISSESPLTDVMHGRSRINFGLFFIFC